MPNLILIRHGQSTWNADNKFTGWVDVPLSYVGRRQAEMAGQKLRLYRIDVCFTSLLIRAIETALICLTDAESVNAGRSPILKHAADDPDWHGWDQYEGFAEQEIPVFTSSALDERYYGELQGLNKAQTTEKFGQEMVYQWRRSFSVKPPGGESLQDTRDRTIPFFQSRITQHLTQGDNVLVAAHGNSLRSIMMVLDNLSEAEIPNLEIATGIPIVYDIDALGKVQSRLVLLDDLTP